MLIRNKGVNFPPTMIKDTSSLETYVKHLQSAKDIVPEDLLKRFSGDFDRCRKGLKGEDHIKHILLDSNIPSYILRDINIAVADGVRQIDFIVITKKLIFVIECKYRTSNIDVNSSGTFIRTKDMKSESSPIEQNEKHVDLLKSLCADGGVHGSVIKNLPNRMRSIIVFANDESILDTTGSPRNVRRIVCRADGLRMLIKRKLRYACYFKSFTEKEMKAVSEFLYGLHGDAKVRNAGKYLRCPQCESSMVTERNKETKRFFWGCMKFNRGSGCKGSRDIC